MAWVMPKHAFEIIIKLNNKVAVVFYIIMFVLTY